MLRTLDTPIDLMLRGFDREVVRERTGEDIGYNGRSLREAAKGIDRMAYKVAHVRERVDAAAVDAVLEQYRLGASKSEVLDALGLAGENIVKLKELFASLGETWSQRFAEADRQRRRGTMRRGMIEAHGVGNPFELESFQRKAEQTRETRYGAKYTLQEGSSLASDARRSIEERMSDPQFRAEVAGKRRATFQRRYGAASAAAVPELLAKMRATSLERYGVESPMQTPAHRQRSREQALATGVDRARKAKQTFLERYGVLNPSMLPENRSAQSRRMLDREHQRRLVEARRMNGTMRSSAPEDELWDLLVAHFGADDVIRQHVDEQRYPFACDFYIPSRDLFIEFNGSWTHGGHWFDEHDVEDAARLESWLSKDSQYYRISAATWSRRDVAKRRAAIEHGLNYVVFWDSPSLDDARLWLALGAPDGNDALEEGSWLPARSIELDRSAPSQLGAGPRQATAAARAANAPVLFARELELWRTNPMTTKGRLRVRLLANRLRYLGKLPDELSDLEILRGMSISGILRGYTAFDNSGMVRVLERHGVESVYDPCAGWGERLVTAAARGIVYQGSDINPEVVQGHRLLVDAAQLSDQSTVCADAQARDMRESDHDAVITCPPYGDVEIYTDRGAENLDHEAFLQWWSQVVQMSISSSTKVFAYQINQRLRDEMNAVVASHGWVLVEQIDVGRSKVGHFHRRPSGPARREFEQMQVFVRV